MADFADKISSPVRNAGNLAFHLFDVLAYEALYRLSPARNNMFFNAGYLPLADDFLHLPEFAGEEHSAMMYHFISKTLLPDPDFQPARVLDIGCGQGGGVAYLSRLYPNCKITGIDRSASVIKRAIRNNAGNSRVCFQKTTGIHLPFEDGSFDFIVGVESPAYFGLSNYIIETARILSPGGIIAFSGGYRNGDHGKIKAEICETAKSCNLNKTIYQDITPNTFASLKADIPRRAKLLKRVPWPFRLKGNNWAKMPGSIEYEEYETGKRADFAAILLSD